APASPATGAVAMPGGVTLLREMPDTYRAQFPITSLDVHVYDPEPARRWVMIGGKRYREGEIVAGGPRIAQITDAGVIFDYSGAQVLLPVH
ncbi:MAG: general secretion pathway protein GspB, partial [Solimonas sp.]